MVGEVTKVVVIQQSASKVNNIIEQNNQFNTNIGQSGSNAELDSRLLILEISFEEYMQICEANPEFASYDVQKQLEVVNGIKTSKANVNSNDVEDVKDTDTSVDMGELTSVVDEVILEDLNVAGSELVEIEEIKHPKLYGMTGLNYSEYQVLTIDE